MMKRLLFFMFILHHFIPALSRIKSAAPSGLNDTIISKNKIASRNSLNEDRTNIGPREIDGIYYFLDTVNKTAEVTNPDGLPCQGKRHRISQHHV